MRFIGQISTNDIIVGARMEVYQNLFETSVMFLKNNQKLDLSILHGDGSNTVAKKGQGIGYSGHKHQKGLKELTLADNNGFVIAPLVVKPVNQHDTILLPKSLDNLADFVDLIDLDLINSYLTLDTGFDSDYNKKCIRALKLIPVIRPNRRGIKNEKKIRKLYDNFNERIYKERYRIERTFAWQDTYRKLVIRYEKLESTHLGFKYLAYSVMNLRVFFGGNSL